MLCLKFKRHGSWLPRVCSLKMLSELRGDWMRYISFLFLPVGRSDRTLVTLHTLFYLLFDKKILEYRYRLSSSIYVCDHPKLEFSAMHRYTIATSALFALALHIFTASSFPLQTTSPQSDTALHPIKLTDYGSSVELQRRSSNDLSNINPQNHTHLIYGSIKGKLFHSLTNFAVDYSELISIYR